MDACESWSSTTNAVRESLRRALELEGYDVELAADGQEALDRLEGGLTRTRSSSTCSCRPWTVSRSARACAAAGAGCPC